MTAAVAGGSTTSVAAGVWVRLVVGLAGTAAGITSLFLSMRSVMGVGGFCAEGGPYAIEVHCPKGVGWLMPVSILGGLIMLALYALAARRVPGPHLLLLGWPALFLSLGWNFWEFGLNPPVGDGLAWGWIICGVVFVLMGGAPLLLFLNPDARRAVFWADVADTRHHRPDGAGAVADPVAVARVKTISAVTQAVSIAVGIWLGAAAFAAVTT